MGTYKLCLNEVCDSMREWLESLEGDFDAELICKSFNKISKKEGWDERITLVPISEETRT